MGVVIVGGGVGVVPVLMDLIQTSDQRRGYYKSMAAMIKSGQQSRGKHPGNTPWTGYLSQGTHSPHSLIHTHVHTWKDLQSSNNLRCTSLETGQTPI